MWSLLSMFGTPPRTSVVYQVGLIIRAIRRMGVGSNDPAPIEFRGDEGIRTLDPHVANVVLSQVIRIRT